MKYIEVFQHGQIVKMPYWNYMMQRVKEHRIESRRKKNVA